MNIIFPKVVQAVAGDHYTVYAYMNDGTVRGVNVFPLIEKGGVFAPLRDPDIFRHSLTVLNDTIAWDLSGKHDPSHCIDLDPFSVQERPFVADPLKQHDE